MTGADFMPSKIIFVTACAVLVVALSVPFVFGAPVHVKMAVAIVAMLGLILLVGFGRARKTNSKNPPAAGNQQDMPDAQTADNVISGQAFARRSAERDPELRETSDPPSVTKTGQSA